MTGVYLTTEAAEVAAALSALRRPAAVVGGMLQVPVAARVSQLLNWINDEKLQGLLAAAFFRTGYVQVPNPNSADGLFLVGGRRQAAFARADLTPSRQAAAVRALVGASS